MAKNLLSDVELYFVYINKKPKKIDSFVYIKLKSILAPIRRNAIIVLTAFIHRFLITYRFSLVLVTVNSVLSAESMSHGCFNTSVADNLFLQM